MSLWNLDSPEAVVKTTDVGTKLLCADVSPDGRWVAAGGADGVVRVWGMGNPEPAAAFAWDVFGIYAAHHTAARLLRDPEAGQKARTSFERLVASARPGEGVAG